MIISIIRNKIPRLF